VLLLRESSQHSGAEIDFNAILGEAGGDVGIAHADILVEFTEAVWGDDDDRLSAARRAIVETMGADALVDASGITATFNAIDRVADATGTPLEETKAEESADLREDLGINVFEPGNA
jgi:hypothetical protein